MALCGDLWTNGRPEEMKAVGADAVLWSVWCDYNADKWNNTIKYEYAKQAENAATVFCSLIRMTMTQGKMKIKPPVVQLVLKPG